MAAGLAPPHSPFSNSGTSRLGFARLKLQLALAVVGSGLLSSLCGLSCFPASGQAARHSRSQPSAREARGLEDKHRDSRMFPAAWKGDTKSVPVSQSVGTARRLS